MKLIFNEITNNNYVLVIPAVLFIILMFFANKIEKVKKENNLRTYQQIVSFLEGKEVKFQKSNFKDKLITISFVIISAVVSFVVTYFGMKLFDI